MPGLICLCDLSAVGEARAMGYPLRRQPGGDKLL